MGQGWSGKVSVEKANETIKGIILEMKQVSYHLMTMAERSKQEEDEEVCIRILRWSLTSSSRTDTMRIRVGHRSQAFRLLSNKHPVIARKILRSHWHACCSQGTLFAA